MKVSLSCLPPFHVYLGNPDKKLKAVQAGSVDGTQEGWAGPRKIFPGLYVGAKSRANKLRKELADYTARKNQASSEDVAQQRKFQQATYSFFHQNEDPALDLKRWKTGYDVYCSTSRISDGRPALLYSYRRKNDFHSVRTAYDIPKKNKHTGNIYNVPSGQHDMKVNGCWVLGLAHHKKPAVLTTPLDDETLFGTAARPVKGQDPEYISSLGREVLGMVQSGHFVANYDERLGKQILWPTPQARFANLEDFKTPVEMGREEIKKQLAAKGIDVSRVSLEKAVKSGERSSHSENQDTSREDNYLPSSPREIAL